jgi:hypothetical protein
MCRERIFALSYGPPHAYRTFDGAGQIARYVDCYGACVSYFLNNQMIKRSDSASSIKPYNWLDGVVGYHVSLTH